MRYLTVSILSLALASPIMVGCDKQVSHTESQSTNPLTGTTTTKEQNTYQRSDGSTYTTTDKHTIDH